MLSPVLSGEKDYEQIIIHGDGWYIKNGITLYKGHKVTAIDRAGEDRDVRSRRRSSAYDKLVIATGSVPFILPVPGNDLPGVLTYRDLDDVNAMLLAAQSRAKAVVIGGGLLGLEAAAGLNARGMDVTVLHLMPTLMERQLDPAAGYLLQRALEARGIKVITKANTKAILGERKVEGVELADGTRHPGDAGRHGGRHPAQRRPRQGKRASTSIAASSSTTACAPPIPTSSRSANAPRSAAMSTASSRRSTRWRASPPRSSPATSTAAFVHNDTPTKLKVTGIDLFSLGDFADGEDRQEIVLRDAARRRLQAPRAQGQPHHRHRALRRDGRRRLVQRPEEEAGRHLRHARHADLRPGLPGGRAAGPYGGRCSLAG